MVGQTKDVGFQIGVRKTFEVGLERAWQLITSPQGMDVWLGGGASLRLEKGATYQTCEGARGELRVLKAHSHLRLTWQPADWQMPSTIQVRVVPAGAKTTISFHQEKLAGPVEREAMRTRWRQVLEQLEPMLASMQGE